MRLAALLPGLLGLLAAPVPAAAQEEVVAGLSRNEISITANFEGSDLLIYGAVKRDEPEPSGSRLEVIVTVEGPSTPITVRRKSRSFGIWINTASVEVDRAPSFYTVATTGPLDEILSQTEDLRRRISVPQMIRSVGAPKEIDNSYAFTEALIRIREANGLYSLHEGAVELAEDTLFRTDVDLPANWSKGPTSPGSSCSATGRWWQCAKPLSTCARSGSNAGSTNSPAASRLPMACWRLPSRRWPAGRPRRRSG